jgi:hypothetical protein
MAIKDPEGILVRREKGVENSERRLVDGRVDQPSMTGASDLGWAVEAHCQ